MKKIIVLAMAVALSLSFATLGFSLKKDIEFAGGGAGKVVFSHEAHSEKTGLKCNDCHTKLFPMKKAPAGTYTMADMKAGKNCGACHDGKKAFSVTAEDKCGSCHKK